MLNFPFLIAPFALLLPLGMQAASEQPENGVGIPATWHQAAGAERRISPLPLSEQAPAWSPVFEGVGPANSEQVRIERRIILRISPVSGAARESLAADAPRAQPNMRVVERAMGKCVESANIGGVADRGDRLLMFMRDRRTIAAKLEKGCSPRDFYRGFYMERSDDGKVCVQRDRLLSRSGAKCQVARFSELVLKPVD